MYDYYCTLTSDGLSKVREITGGKPYNETVGPDNVESEAAAKNAAARIFLEQACQSVDKPAQFSEADVASLAAEHFMGCVAIEWSGDRSRRQ